MPGAEGSGQSQLSCRASAIGNGWGVTRTDCPVAWGGIVTVPHALVWWCQHCSDVGFVTACGCMAAAKHAHNNSTNCLVTGVTPRCFEALAVNSRAALALQVAEQMDLCSRSLVAVAPQLLQWLMLTPACPGMQDRQFHGFHAGL